MSKNEESQLAEFEDDLFLDYFTDKFMPSLNTSYLYHYTSAQGFNSILFCGDCVKLWASRYDCMNDTSEGKIVDEIYQQVCQELLNDNTINQEQYELLFNIHQNNLTVIYYALDNKYINGKHIDGRSCFLPCDRYLCCFSKNKDSLAMWNYYTKNDKYEGYNIEFDYLNTNEHLHSLFGRGVHTSIYPIVYSETEQKKIVKEYICKIIQKFYPRKLSALKQYIANQLFDWSLVFKSEYFKHEEEVRLIIYIPQERPQDIDNPECFTIKHRFDKGLIIPYIELEFDKNCITGVNIAPIHYTNTEKENQKRILEKVLAQQGYQSVLVDYSKVPIRF